MKTIVASVGLIALGASGLQMASAQTMASPEPSKPWSISASLRGFYDDNINSSPLKRDSFGFDVNPGGALNLSLEQTQITAGATYGLRYYDRRPAGDSDNYDQNFTFDAALSHAFNEEYKASVSDSFVLGQEPDQIRAGNNAFSEFQRQSGDNIRNYGVVTLDGKLTRQLGFEAGYDNSFYDYSDNTIYAGTGTQAGAAATLNRLEHGIHLEGRWEFTPETFGIVGFRYRETDYTADKLIQVDNNGANVYSDFRDERMYSPYVGLSHVFTPALSASVDVGATYAEYPNDPTTSANWSPYVNLSGRYNYTPESYVEVGYTQDRNSTSVTYFGGDNRLTQDQASSTVYGSINHHLTSKLLGTVMAQYQNSVFNGGGNGVDNASEQYFLVGLNLEYSFTTHFSANVGYNYDKLDSATSVAGSFDRNRVYMGVTAKY